MAVPARVGFIFDLDGVVVDSNRLHVESWRAVAHRHGYPLADPAHIGKCGLRTTAVIRDLLQWPVSKSEAQRIGWEKEELYRDWIRADGIRAIPGVLEFVRQTRVLGIPCAVGSSAPRDNVAVCLAALGLTHAFQAAVSGEDVTHGKPAPDIFLTAAAAIEIHPADCIVFEDAPAGITAAQAAGIRVVALTTSHLRDELAGADRIVQDFTDLVPQRLCGEFGYSL